MGAADPQPPRESDRRRAAGPPDPVFPAAGLRQPLPRPPPPAGRPPLFPGYIFLHGDREATFVADRTRRIAGILDVDRHQQPELHQELDNLRKAIQLEAGFDPYPYLRHGHWAEVKSGPYKGLRGRIDREAAPGKLILQVDLLQSAMALELDGAELEPLSNPGRQKVESRK